MRSRALTLPDGSWLLSVNETAPRQETAARTPTRAPPDDLQESPVAGTARRYELKPRAELAQIHTRQHAAEFFQRHPARTR